MIIFHGSKRSNFIPHIRSHLIYFTFIFLWALSIEDVNALIDDPVSQRTTIAAYIPSLMDPHSYFDTSFKDGASGSSLVQAD